MPSASAGRFIADIFRTGVRSAAAGVALDDIGEETQLASLSLGFDVGGLRVRTSNMLHCYSHVSCSVERRGVSQHLQVRTCVVNEEVVALELVRKLPLASPAVSARLPLPDGIELRLDAVPTLLNTDLPGTKAAIERILDAAAGHMCSHTVALAAALPGVLADAEPAAPPRRPAAVPVASPFAATRAPAGLRSPSATPSKGSSGDDPPSARRGSVASHVGHAQLLPSFDSEAGSAALGGAGHGVGSVELPAQDSQQLSGFDRIDSVRMPSFGDHFRMPSFSDNFRTVRAASLNDHLGDRSSTPSGLVFNSSSRPLGSPYSAISPLPSFMQRQAPGVDPDGDAGGAAGPRPAPASPALARAGSSSTTRPQLRKLSPGGALAARDSSHSLQHYLDNDGVQEGHQLLQPASPRFPDEVAVIPGMGRLFITPPGKSAVSQPGPVAAAELRAEIDAAFGTATTPRRSRLEGFEVMGLEAEARSHSLGSAGSQSLSGFSVAVARTLSHGSSVLDHLMDGAPSCRGRSSTESVPEVEAVLG